MFAETPAIYIIPSSFWDFPYTRFWLGSKCTYLGKSFIFVVVILYVPMARNGVVFFLRQLLRIYTELFITSLGIEGISFYYKFFFLSRCSHEKFLITDIAYS